MPYRDLGIYLAVLLSVLSLIVMAILLLKKYVNRALADFVCIVLLTNKKNIVKKLQDNVRLKNNILL